MGDEVAAVLLFVFVRIEEVGGAILAAKKITDEIVEGEHDLVRRRAISVAGVSCNEVDEGPDAAGKLFVGTARFVSVVLVVHGHSFELRHVVMVTRKLGGVFEKISLVLVREWQGVDDDVDEIAGGIRETFTSRFVLSMNHHLF